MLNYKEFTNKFRIAQLNMGYHISGLLLENYQQKAPHYKKRILKLNYIRTELRDLESDKIYELYRDHFSHKRARVFRIRFNYPVEYSHNYPIFWVIEITNNDITFKKRATSYIVHMDLKNY